MENRATTASSTPTAASEHLPPLGGPSAAGRGAETSVSTASQTAIAARTLTQPSGLITPVDGQSAAALQADFYRRRAAAVALMNSLAAECNELVERGILPPRAAMPVPPPLPRPLGPSPLPRPQVAGTGSTAPAAVDPAADSGINAERILIK